MTAPADGAASGAVPPANGGASPFLFSLSKTAPMTFDGGTLRGANKDTFPVLTEDQKGSVYLVHLDVGGIREPHWHPSAWELNYILSGTAKWTMLGTHGDGSYHNSAFTANQGDLVFAPQGFFHYFENGSKTQGLDVLVIFNTSVGEPSDDIGIVGTLNSLPRDVLAATFGVPESAFKAIPTKIEPVVITKRK
ncbi:cupin domain-containing protein [Amycolatopsis sp. NPDC059021]|uniref:cupin domain-containing protein n=1 Tax=Amycolatopsis sp. NPDC059021 TaxID=3346704 RepID=UPI00366B1564